MRTMIYRIFPSHLIQGHNLTHMLQWICFHIGKPNFFRSLVSNPNLRKSPEIRRFLALIYLSLTSRLLSQLYYHFPTKSNLDDTIHKYHLANMHLLLYLFQMNNNLHPLMNPKLIQNNSRLLII